MHHEGKPHRLLTAAEERGLARRVHGSDKADATLAANTLALRNIGLVGAAVAWYRDRCPHLEYDDAFSEGMLGLLQASRLYDPAKNPSRFSSYASKAIFNHINEWLMLNRSVRVPMYLQRVLHRCACGCDSHDHDHDNERLAKATIARARTKSLNQAEDMGDRFGPEDPTPGPMQAMENQENLARLWSSLAMINPVYSYVLVCRFGLGGNERRTLDSLADELDLTREGVRQMQQRGVQKLAAIFLAPDQRASFCA